MQTYIVESRYFLHLQHLIRCRINSEEGTVEILLQHVGKSQRTNKVTVTDGGTCIGTEVDFFQETKLLNCQKLLFILLFYFMQ